MQSRNKYIEGKRRLRAKPFITAKAILLTFLLSFVAYTGFWFYTGKDGGVESQKINIIGEQILLSFLLIGITVIAATGVGAFIGWLKGRTSDSRFILKDADKVRPKGFVEQENLDEGNPEKK